MNQRKVLIIFLGRDIIGIGFDRTIFRVEANITNSDFDFYPRVQVIEHSVVLCRQGQGNFL